MRHLRAATGPGTRRILLLDAPAVLGWRTWHELDDLNSVTHLREALEQLSGPGAEPLVRIVSGALNESASWLATLPVDQREAALGDSVELLGRMLGAVRS